jgi:S-DNA-T family DNA segregation ATPase FtsK/SpoIIIE
MAAARPKTRNKRAGAARSPRPRAARRPGPRPQTRHGREIGAVACAATAVFLVFVLYLGWAGGFAGDWLTTALRWSVGSLTYLSPFVLFFIAAMLVGGERQRPSRPLGIGIALLCAAYLLAAAANSFGMFAPARPRLLFHMTYMHDHGGVVGETLWAGTRSLLGRIGTNVLVVASALAGFLLVSGSSLGLWASRSREGMSAAGRAARESARAAAERKRTAAAQFAERPYEAGLPWPDADTVAYGPAASAHGTRFVDGAREVPEIFAGGSAATAHAAQPHKNEFDEVTQDLGDDEQLSLAEAAPESAEGVATAMAFSTGEHRQWVLPDPSLLRRLGEGHGETPATIEEVSRRLVETLGHFGVETRVVNTVSGPRVTRYELQLAPGVKVSRVASLKDDLAYSLAATDIRVQAPIPGKQAVGVEVPNVQPNFVGLGDIYQAFPPNASPLAFWLGKDITGKAVLADLVRMVHVLIAGTTGSGKSGCINCIISSILLRATPDQVRMIMIDPKKVELSHFDGVPHLLAPVVTNMKNASYVLANVVREMEARYERMSRTGTAQNLRELNKKLERSGETPLPYIVLVIDELADLMMVAPAEVEDAIIRLGQLGRGAGIHLVVATQRPSVDVVTGMIKTNIPSRIGFAVSSQTDSRVILDTGGAESLLGDGDMLFHPFGSSRMLRVQGAFMTPGEMKMITEHWKAQASPEFREDLLEGPPGAEPEIGHGSGEDELLADAITTVVSTGAASVALLQRRLRVGYARAGRLIDIMEGMGIISGYDGSKARNVLISEGDIGGVLKGVAGGRPAPVAAVEPEPEDL